MDAKFDSDSLLQISSFRRIKRDAIQAFPSLTSLAALALSSDPGPCAIFYPTRLIIPGKKREGKSSFPPFRPHTDVAMTGRIMA